MVFADVIITRLINNGAHKLLNIEAGVEKCDLSLMKGSLTLYGMELQNPDGFKSSRMIHIQQIHVSMMPRTVLSECIRIKNVEIMGMDLNYEAAGFGRSNLSVFLRDLRDHISGLPILGGDDGEDKRVIIDRILLQGGRITLSTVMGGSGGVSLPMPPVELYDIGKDSPMGPSQVVAEVLRRLGEEAVSAAERRGGLR